MLVACVRPARAQDDERGAPARSSEWLVSSVTCHYSATGSIPADNALKRFAVHAGVAAREHQRSIALDNCAECTAALAAHRQVALELAAAHAEGCGVWERLEQTRVMPEVLAADGVWRSAASGRCQNAQVLQCATRLSVLTSRWSMGHSH